MSYDILGPEALDYVPCTYGTSKLVFRGPARVLEAPYVAFLGGTQTFGKFIEQPYPLKVEHLTGVASVNFGQMNAGPDVYLKDQVVLEAARGARVTVLEVLGAANMNNRLYRVHMRRNDRFLRASEELERLYPDVDFSQFNFTQHMLRHLRDTGPEQFFVLERCLQRTWMRRMRQLLGQLGRKVVLVHLQGGAVTDPERPQDWPGAAFVTDQMIDNLRGLVSAVVDVRSENGRACETAGGMVFHKRQGAAARAVVGPHVHSAAAQALQPVLDRLMQV
jgi:hypothetical protein